MGLLALPPELCAHLSSQVKHLRLRVALPVLNVEIPHLFPKTSSLSSDVWVHSTSTMVARDQGVSMESASESSADVSLTPLYTNMRGESRDALKGASCVRSPAILEPSCWKSAALTLFNVYDVATKMGGEQCYCLGRNLRNGNNEGIGMCYSALSAHASSDEDAPIRIQNPSEIGQFSRCVHV